MTKTLILLFSITVIAIGAIFFVVAVPSREEVNMTPPPAEIVIEAATSSLPGVSEATSTTKKTIQASSTAPVKTPQKKPVVVAPVQPNPPAPPGTGITPPIMFTTVPSTTIGTTTLAVNSVPLLSGGTVHAGEAVPVSYLQITNTGTAGAQLKGFWIRQNGSASATSVIGLSTVDDKGGSRGSSGGTEGTVLFQNQLAYAPTDAYFAPGQMRLFTIKVLMTNAVSAYVGTQLIIDVPSIDSTAAVTGQFPIPGTVWTISQ